MVKCIADNAISWIYTPVNTGHIDLGHGTEESGTERLECEVGSDEIVIDEEVEDRLGHAPPGPSHIPLDQETVVRLTEEGMFAVSSTRLADSPEVESCDSWHPPTASVSRPEGGPVKEADPSHFQTSASSEDKSESHSEKDEVVAGLVEVGHSTDDFTGDTDSSVVTVTDIDDESQSMPSMPNYNHVKSMIDNMRAHFGSGPDIEFVVHEMTGWPGSPDPGKSHNEEEMSLTLAYVCHVVMTPPVPGKVWGFMGTGIMSSRESALESISGEILGAYSSGPPQGP